MSWNCFRRCLGTRPKDEMGDGGHHPLSTDHDLQACRARGKGRCFRSVQLARRQGGRSSTPSPLASQRFLVGKIPKVGRYQRSTGTSLSAETKSFCPEAAVFERLSISSRRYLLRSSSAISTNSNAM